MDEPGPACPGVLGQRIRNHWCIAEIGTLGGPLARQLVEVEVFGPPRTPVKRHGPLDTFLDRRFDHRFDWREARAARNEYDRLLALAHEERSEGPFESEDVALLHGLEDVLGERAPRDI